MYQFINDSHDLALSWGGRRMVIDTSYDDRNLICNWRAIINDDLNLILRSLNSKGCCILGITPESFNHKTQ